MNQIRINQQHLAMALWLLAVAFAGNLVVRPIFAETGRWPSPVVDLIISVVCGVAFVYATVSLAGVK